jgi:DNA-binding GntR family transcriptional regulator
MEANVPLEPIRDRSEGTPMTGAEQGRTDGSEPGAVDATRDDETGDDALADLAKDRGAGRNSFEAVVSRLASGYRSIGDMVYQVLREAILSGAFLPGEHLRQEALATAIGVSRLPVRAALLKLDAEGLVEFSPHRGAVVQTLSHKEIAEIYELRDLLETYALRKSMERMTPQRITLLQDLAAQLDAEAEGDPFLEVRVRFYRELYDAGNAPRLIELIEGLRSSVGRYLLGRRVSDGNGHGHHYMLVEHVASGDVNKAEAWLRQHLREVSAGVDHILYGDGDPNRPPK